MLIFHRPEFLLGSMKVEDVKLDDKGKPVFKTSKTGSLFDASGNPLKKDQCFIYWHLTPDMKGKIIKFNDEKYVKKKYPNFFFKTDKEIEAFEKRKKDILEYRNKRKIIEREKELLADIEEAKQIDDPGLIQHSQDQQKKFVAERKRFNR